MMNDIMNYDIMTTKTVYNKWSKYLVTELYLVWMQYGNSSVIEGR